MKKIIQPLVLTCLTISAMGETITFSNWKAAGFRDNTSTINTASITTNGVTFSVTATTSANLNMISDGTLWGITGGDAHYRMDDGGTPEESVTFTLSASGTALNSLSFSSLNLSYFNSDDWIDLSDGITTLPTLKTGGSSLTYDTGLAGLTALTKDNVDTWQLTLDVVDGSDTIFSIKDMTLEYTLYTGPQAPVAHFDSYTVAMGSIFTNAAPGILSNDTDGNGDSLTAIQITSPSNGTLLSFSTNGAFIYQPDSLFYGSDSFTYQAHDGSLTSETATVTLTIPRNEPPFAVADAYSIVRGSELNVPAPGVVMNDEDPNGDALSAILISTVNDGTLSLHSNGSFNYIPAVGYTGTVHFTYASFDGNTTGTIATASIQVFEPIAVERPNILIFFADDMGRGDSRVYNSSTNPPPAQPTIEAFAEASMIFRDAHTQASLCAPSRYCILTGNYPWRGRLEGGSWHMNTGAQVMPGQQTLAHVLNDAGYHTAIIGKGHLGAEMYDTNGVSDTRSMIWTSDDIIAFQAGDLSKQDTHYDPTMMDWSQPVSNGVHSSLVGFDYSYMLYAGIQAPLYAYFENDYIVGDPADLELWNNPNYATSNGVHQTYRPGFGLRGLYTCDVGPTLTQKTLNFIDAHVATNTMNGTDAPFFIHYCAEAVHSPHTPPTNFLGTVVAGTTDYPHSDMLVELDVAFSNILYKLEAQGLLDNTLVIFTSDNGGLSTGEAQSGHNPNEGLRGEKASIWEGGHSVPLFIKWGDRIPAGSYDHMVGIHDLYATIAQLVGKPQGEAQGLDAVSFLSVLLRGNVAPVRRTLLHGLGGSINDIAFARGRALREGNYKLLWDKTTNLPVYLYDLSIDPMESIDLLNDPAQVQRVARMSEKLNQFVLLTKNTNRHFSARSEPLPALQDSNQNGLDDEWEIFYFGSLNAPNGDPLDDYDSDTLNNLLEFAFGSDPSVIDDPSTVSPSFEIDGHTFKYIYRRRQDAASRNLHYTPKQTLTLTSNLWNADGLTEVGSTFIDADIESVTNYFSMNGTSNRFFKLEIEAK